MKNDIEHCEWCKIVLTMTEIKHLDNLCVKCHQAYVEAKFPIHPDNYKTPNAPDELIYPDKGRSYGKVR